MGETYEVDDDDAKNVTDNFKIQELEVDLRQLSEQLAKAEMAEKDLTARLKRAEEALKQERMDTQDVMKALRKPGGEKELRDRLDKAESDLGAAQQALKQERTIAATAERDLEVERTRSASQRNK